MTTSQPNPTNSLDPNDLRPKQGLRARLFAKMMARGNDTHDRQITPYKRRLLADLHGDLVEIGPGAGANFEFYAPDVRWVGVEPNPYMFPYLRAAAVQHGIAIDLRTGYTEALPVADQSADVVVSTLVLCSVRDIQATLAEIRRVLRPGGKYAFIEHVAAPAGSGLRRLQNGIRPLWSFVTDGCQPNRELWRSLEAAGFSQVAIEHFTVNVPIVGPHIAGYAIK
jgi:ubiquinone/menaquinone biosynthesis C-methylase UbiE